MIVDGAHSFAHIDFNHADLDCDYYGTSLHKFLFAPHGTGMLFVRKEDREALAADAGTGRDGQGHPQFEEIGTHPRRISSRSRTR